MKYEIIGWTDEVHDCDFCGKTELKSVAVIKDIESGDILYFGCDCAKKATGIPSKELKKEAKQKQKELDRINTLQAEKEFRETPEYIAYKAAMSYADEHMRLDQVGYKVRLNYIASFSDAYNAKKKEIQSKYNVGYIC